jgi:anti-sigma B factor antagonist
MYDTESPDLGSTARTTPPGARGAGLDPSLVCDTLEVDGRAVVTLRGELDLATAPDLLRTLQHLLDQRITALTLDLADLSFIDSSGLGTLCRVLADAQERGATLELDRVPDHARRVLEITGLTELFSLG